MTRAFAMRFASSGFGAKSSIDAPAGARASTFASAPVTCAARSASTVVVATTETRPPDDDGEEHVTRSAASSEAIVIRRITTTLQMRTILNLGQMRLSVKLRK